MSFAQDSTHEEKVSSHEDEGKLDIVEKVVDHDYVDFYFFGKLYLPKFEPIHIGSIEIDLSPTKSLFMMILSSLLLIIVLRRAVSLNTKNKVPKGIGNFIETIVIFIRDDIVLPNMGKDGLKMLPFILTIFFFILFANLIGLFPFMAQPTKNINVTTGLALITFFTTQIYGMKKNGVVGYFKGLIPPGVPTFVLPIMIIVEFIGLFTKPFALLMRLFANITAGSIIILSLIGLIFIMSYAGIIIAVPFAIFIYCLEIFVAVLQAYIFTMLSVLFINMAIHQEH
ncbi:MAG: F0F1 ATP synthase subunit A [Ignavibacteria bacterium]|nr:F0F1 ATP synthase subunit A [Ignavibacteria bacterium]